MGGGKVQASTLIGSDLVRAMEASRYLCLLPMSSSGLVGGCVLLVLSLGWAGVIGIAAMVLATCLNFELARRIKATERLELRAADRRLGLLRLVIGDIKPIKLLSWEEQYMDAIDTARRVEVGYMRRFRILYQGSTQIGRAVPFLAACPAFVYISQAGGGLLDAADVFAALSVFTSLRMALIMLPTGLAEWARIQVSFARVERYLELPEHAPLPPLPPLPPATPDAVGTPPLEEAEAATPRRDLARASPSDGAPSWEATLEGGAAGTALARVDEAVFAWSGGGCGGGGGDGGRFLLQVGSGGLEVGGDEVVGVVGPIGSGKSSLLCAVLGEMPRLAVAGSGRIADAAGQARVWPAQAAALVRSVCYVQQRPCVLSCSILENITFGAPLRRLRLARAIEGACLGPDLQQMPAGLDTLVGERGVTLSGGQQMRVALARALYQRPALLFADDPLAAVDARVGAHLFRSLREYATGGRAVVLALNQLHLARRCSRLVVLEAGRITAQGPSAEVATDHLSAFPSPQGDEAGSAASVGDTGSEIAEAGASPAEAGGALGEERDGAVAELSVAAAVECSVAAAKLGAPAQRTAEARRTGRFSGSTLCRYLRSFGRCHFALCCVLAAAAWGLRPDGLQRPLVGRLAGP